VRAQAVDGDNHTLSEAFDTNISGCPAISLPFHGGDVGAIPAGPTQGAVV